MLEFLKWLVASKEMAELERWRIEWNEHRRWLAEFPLVGLALDNMKSEVEGKQSVRLSDLRERMRGLCVTSNETALWPGCDCATRTSADGKKLTYCGSDQMRRAVSDGHAFSDKQSNA